MKGSRTFKEPTSCFGKKPKISAAVRQEWHKQFAKHSKHQHFQKLPDSERKPTFCITPEKHSGIDLSNYVRC